MSSWIPAAHDHRGLLSVFECVEKAPASRGFRLPHPRPWAAKAQSLIRDIRSPFKPPKYCEVRLSTDGGRVDAVIAFYDEPMRENQHHFHLNVLARHLACKSESVGAEALDTFTQRCLEIVETLPAVERIVLTAEAHKANLQVRRLLAGTLWQRSSDVNPDPNYENWEHIIDIAPLDDQTADEISNSGTSEFSDSKPGRSEA